MKLNITFELKYDTEAQADTAVNYINNNYGTYLLYVRKVDMASAMAEGIFPKAWGVRARLLFNATQFLEHKTTFNDLIDNHASDIFNFAANTSHELE